MVGTAAATSGTGKTWVRVLLDETITGMQGVQGKGWTGEVWNHDARRMVSVGRCEILTSEPVEPTRVAGETKGTSEGALKRGGRGRAVRHAETR